MLLAEYLPFSSGGLILTPALPFYLSSSLGMWTLPQCSGSVPSLMLPGAA